MKNWKECGRKRSWPNLRYCPLMWLEGLGKTTKDLSHDNMSSDRDLKPGFPECEAPRSENEYIINTILYHIN
jgi:hypothetical protein